MSSNAIKDLSKGGSDDPAIAAIAARALEFVQDGARVGLGSGRASHAFIKALGAHVRAGLKVQGVPTSVASEKLAFECGIPLIALTEDVVLDLTIDGADEISPHLDLIKGWGGALVRERIVAQASKAQIILAGAEKQVKTLGERGRIPVEIIPLAQGLATRLLKKLGLSPTLRLIDHKPFISDNGNLTLDCALSVPIAGRDAAWNLEREILSIAGVVDTGLFIGTASRVLIGHPDGRVEELRA